MTMYTASVQGLPLAPRAVRLGVLLVLSVLVAGCDVEWGGASFHFENPVPEPEVPEDAVVEEAVVPLPTGPLLWVVRSTGSGGDALAMPVARIDDGVPVALEFPAPVPDGYRARFDSAFAAAGRELALATGGTRVGSLVFTGSPRILDAGCPSAVPARTLLPPGGTAPLISFGVAGDLFAGDIALASRPEPDNRIRTFGPILAEQLLRAGGEDQPFLAQRADLVAVDWPGDEQPAMAATYLINDELQGDPPQREAVSLFFLARFDPAVGYVAEWSEMRTYGPGTREAFTWLAAVPGPHGRIDFAILHDGVSRRLVASAARDAETRTIDWTEGNSCPSLVLLESAGG